jgi:hypothetical protein
MPPVLQANASNERRQRKGTITMVSERKSAQDTSSDSITLLSGDAVSFVPGNGKLGTYALRFAGKTGVIEGPQAPDGRWLVNFGADHIWLREEHLKFVTR